MPVLHPPRAALDVTRTLTPRARQPQGLTRVAEFSPCNAGTAGGAQAGEGGLNLYKMGSKSVLHITQHHAHIKQHHTTHHNASRCIKKHHTISMYHTHRDPCTARCVLDAGNTSMLHDIERYMFDARSVHIALIERARCCTIRARCAIFLPTPRCM